VVKATDHWSGSKSPVDDKDADAEEEIRVEPFRSSGPRRDFAMSR
jgi:hypothetical protein